MSRVSMADLLTLARLSAYAGERRAAAKASFSGVHHLSKLFVFCPSKSPH
jgi:hypothetical protein